MIHPAFGDDFHIVSVSYRYIPQVGIAEEIEDCVDAFQWCRQNLPSIVPGIDIEKYWVGGDSAGGTLSTLMGHHLKPSPRAVLDVYGVVDFLDPHFYSPYPAAIDLIGREDLEKRLEVAIQDRDPSRAAHARPARFHLGLPAEVLRSFWGKEDLQLDLEAATFDCDLYDYTTAKGKRVTLLLRKEECATEDEFDERCREHSSLHMLVKKEKEGAKAYPPCFILHGTGDALVPVDQSYRFEQKLKEVGIPVQARYFDGEPHGFDQRIDVSSGCYPCCRSEPMALSSTAIQGLTPGPGELRVVDGRSADHRLRPHSCLTEVHAGCARISRRMHARWRTPSMVNEGTSMATIHARIAMALACMFVHHNRTSFKAAGERQRRG
jgi:acetyl esterase/lipase